MARLRTFGAGEDIDPPDDGFLDDESREAAERRRDEEADAAYDHWAEEHR